MRRFGMLAALLLWAAAQSGCATNPVTGQRQISLVSSEQELSIGQEGYKAVIQEYGSYEDAALAQFVDRVGQKDGHVSHLPDLKWHFTVLDDPTVNAFAMPGGYIYVTRGILAHLNSEAQLAGVLGHECGHVTARHSAQQITKQELYGLGLGVAGLFSTTLRQYSGLAQQGLQLLFLSYSRENENQADDLGVQYSTKAGYDPRDIPRTYVMLGRISAASGQRLPSFLSTHPDPGNREVHTTQLANQAAAGKTGLVVNGPSYVDRLDGIVFGADPRQGFFESAHFYHPQMRFHMSFPSGWTTQNGRASVVAVSSGKTAQMQLTLANAGSLSPSEFVAELGRKGSIADASGRRETIGGYDAWVGRIAVAAQDGSRQSLAAAWIRRNEQMFQFLGASQTPGGDEEAQIVESVRSFRELTDPARLNVVPNRLRVMRASSAGSFRSAVSQLGSQAISVEQTAILNDKELEDRVAAGERIKIVVPGSRR